MIRTTLDGGTSVAKSVPCRGVIPPFPAKKTARETSTSIRRQISERKITVPSFVGSDETEVLALRLGTFSNATRYSSLELVRRSNSFVTLLQLNGERDRISDSISTPGSSDARLDRSKRLSVGGSRFESSLVQSLPDIGEIGLLSSKEIDSLTSSHLAKV